MSTFYHPSRNIPFSFFNGNPKKVLLDSAKSPEELGEIQKLFSKLGDPIRSELGPVFYAVVVWVLTLLTGLLGVGPYIFNRV